MSINVSMTTGHKQKLANLLRAIADFIEESTNQRISCGVEIQFLDCPKKEGRGNE